MSYPQQVPIEADGYSRVNSFHFAVSGKSFAVLFKHFPEYVPRVITMICRSVYIIFWCNKILSFLTTCKSAC